MKPVRTGLVAAMLGAVKSGGPGLGATATGDARPGCDGGEEGEVAMSLYYSFL